MRPPSRHLGELPVDGRECDNGEVSWPRRAIPVLALWTAATAVGLLFAGVTRIGPVVMRLSYRHGVHLGDLVAFVAAYGGAALLTWHLRKRA